MPTSQIGSPSTRWSIRVLTGPGTRAPSCQVGDVVTISCMLGGIGERGQ
jgi:hypothetical protein